MLAVAAALGGCIRRRWSFTGACLQLDEARTLAAWLRAAGHGHLAVDTDATVPIRPQMRSTPLPVARWSDMTKPRHRRWWVYWVVFGILETCGYTYALSYNTWQRRMCLYAIEVTVTAAIIVGVRVHRPTKPVIWYLLATGQGLTGLSSMAFGFEKYVLEHPVFPYFDDCLALAAYPAFAAGVFVLIRGRASRRDRAGLLDASIVFTGLALLAWAFVMRPLAANADLSISEKLVSLAYPAGDLVLIAMVARLFTTPGARTLSYKILMTGLLITTVGDVVYLYFVATDVNTKYLTAVALLGSVAFGAATLHPSMRPLSETAPDQAERLTGLRLALLTTTSLLAPAVLIYQGLTEPTNIDWKAASLGAILLFLLVVGRMSVLVSQVQDQAAQLDALAHNDALTGVPNRRAWDLELVRRLAHARRSNTAVVIAVLDIDHFKIFNDQFGHQAGDRLLKEAAATWRSELRADDLLARYGGEEFGVCITELDAGGVVSLLHRVKAATPLNQSFSAGVAAWNGAEAPERLVARADEALYEAKRAGRKRIMIHNGDTIETPMEPLIGRYSRPRGH
jgi:diguanylate cyclase (GGDEF)-like protein